MFRVAPRREMQLETDPFSGQKWEPPAPPEGVAGGTVDFIADEDDRSEIEKLKAERRAKRLEKEQAASCAGGGEGGSSSSDAAPKDAAAPVPPPTASRDSSAGTALEALQAAETGAKALQARLDHLTGQVKAVEAQSVAPLVPKQELQDACRTMNKLLAGLDEISLGDIADDEKRSDARGRKKQVAACLEMQLMPAANALLARLESGTAATGPPAAKPVVAPAAPPGKSAEIDSDED